MGLSFFKSLKKKSVLYTVTKIIILSNTPGFGTIRICTYYYNVYDFEKKKTVASTWAAVGSRELRVPPVSSHTRTQPARPLFTPPRRRNLAQTSSDTHAVAPAADTIRHNYLRRRRPVVCRSRVTAAPAIVRTICSNVVGRGGGLMRSLRHNVPIIIIICRTVKYTYLHIIRAYIYIYQN